MKNILLVLPMVALLATGCNPTSQTSIQNPNPATQNMASSDSKEQIYTDSLFSFTYPKSWTALKLKDQSLEGSNYHIEFTNNTTGGRTGEINVIYKNIPTTPGGNLPAANFTDELKAAQRTYTLTNNKSFTLDSHQADSFDVYTPRDKMYGSQILIDGGDYYIFGGLYSFNEADLPTFHTLLSSFKLTK